MTKTVHPTPELPPCWVKVPSWLVTPEMLRRWGFEVKSCPTSHESHEGEEFGKARHRAWAAGWTVQASRPEGVECPHKRRAQKTTPEGLQAGWELLFWFRTEGKIRAR